MGLFNRFKAVAKSVRTSRFGSALWGSRSSGGVRGEEAWLAEIGKNGRLLTPIHTIATDVSVVPWRVQRKNEKRKFEDFVPDAGESAEKLAALWAQPHPRIPRSTFLYISQTWMESVGRCAWRMMEFDEFGRPSQLVPIPPHWIEEIPSTEKPFFKTRYWGHTGTIDVPAEEMLYFTRPDPRDPLRECRGIAQSVDDEVNQDTAMAKFNTFYFKNFAMLGVILGIPGYDDNKEEIDASIKEKHTGSENAFKTLIADSNAGNVTATNLGPSMRDLNFPEGRKLNRDFIREAWQVPPERAGVLENSNRSTIDGADFFQQSKNALPRLVCWQEEFDLKLTPLFDDRNEELIKAEIKAKRKCPRLLLTFQNPVTETEDHKLKVTQAGVRMGWVTINEARARHGFDIVDGGDVFLLPINNVAAVPVVGGDFMAVTGPKAPAIPKKEGETNGTP